MRITLLVIGCCIISNAYSEEHSFQLDNALQSAQEVSGVGPEFVLTAIQLLGTPYKYGGSSPENGMDCSGLVRYVFKDTSGTELPRTSYEISQIGKKIHPKDLQLGDLVFYNTLRRAYSHVGIYLGHNKFMHAPASGGYVRIENMDLKYWKKRFNGARRIDVTKEEITPLMTAPKKATMPIS